MTAGAFSFGFLVSAVVTPFVGRLMDLRGPRVRDQPVRTKAQIFGPVPITILPWQGWLIDTAGWRSACIELGILLLVLLGPLNLLLKR